MRLVLPMSNGEMAVENGRGIAQNHVIVPIENQFLLCREVSTRTKNTACLIECSSTAAPLLTARRIELQRNIIFAAVD